jgi:tetratricopeptide (TPR) repeat protein
LNSFCRQILISVVIAMAPSVAVAVQVDWTGCAVPNAGDDKRKAIEACSRVLARELTDADRERALIVRGRAAHRAGDLDAAIRDFDEAINLAPKEPEPLARRASAAFEKRDYPNAFIFARHALQLDANHPGALDTLGVIAMVSGNFAMGKEAFDRAIALKPDNVVYRFHRHQYWMRIGAGPEALKEIEDLLALKTSDLDTQFLDFRGRDITYRAMARLNRATMLESMGRFPEALKAFDDFVQTDPGPFSYGWRGWYYFNRDNFDLAKADLDKALSYDPNFWILHNLEGLVYLYKQEYERAVASFDRSLALKPDYSGSSYWSRALALRALHRTGEAKKDALKAFSEDPTFLGQKRKTLTRLGYLQPAANDIGVQAAVRDAVEACMLDEKCW